MNPNVQSLVAEIELWLKDQAPTELESERYYALGSLIRFASTIKADDSEASLAKASWGLSHQLSDQYDWPLDDCKVIGEFLARARRVHKEMKNS